MAWNEDLDSIREKVAGHFANYLSRSFNSSLERGKRKGVKDKEGREYVNVTRLRDRRQQL